MPEHTSIFITGAASGIGLGLARYFAERGHRVFASDVNGAAVGRLADELTKAGYAAHAVALDVTSASAVEVAMKGLGEDVPEVLINNAGLQFVAHLEDFPPEKWQQLIAVMLTGAALLTRAFLPSMRARGWGRIVNVGSIHSLVASPYKSAYVAAKHGLVGFSKVVALETHDCDITINTVCPSYVMTPLVDAQIDKLAETHGLPREQVIEEIMLKPMPKKRFIGIGELAGAIEFLLGDAARNITGQCITIDGGWTAQ